MTDISESEADWRIAKPARLKGDHTLSGEHYKDGTLLWQATATEDALRRSVVFPTPSPAALAINIAFGAARTATKIRDEAGLQALAEQPIRDPLSDKLRGLFSYFEQCMVAAVFSFQTIEAHCNQVIEATVKGPFVLPRRNGSVSLSLDELERQASTDEKITTVLPKLLGVQSPKGKRVWEEYRRLKATRDSTVHLKSKDQYVRGKIDKESLYYRFLTTAPVSYPVAAVHVIHHFSGTAPPRWLTIVSGRPEMRE